MSISTNSIQALGPTSTDGFSARALCTEARLGNFDEPLAVLAAATEATAALVTVRDTVSEELARRAADLYVDVTRRAVHALGVSPLTAETMVVDPDGRLHVIAKRVPNEDAIGVELHTACGLTLWSDLEAPLQAGMRGSWQQPNAYEVVRCPGCGDHASDYPETRERPGDPTLPEAVASQVNATVSARVAANLIAQMPRLAPCGATVALDTAAAQFHEALVEQLVIETRSSEEDVLQRVLLRYYDSARRQLAACGHQGPLAGLVSDADWQEAVSNLLEDIQDTDNTAVAQSYLYGELRSILGERIRLGAPLTPVRRVGRRPDASLRSA
jgi:hypothetical protein